MEDKAKRLRSLADTMQRQIDQKLHPSIANQRPTRRRANIAEGMAREAMRLQKVQRGLRALADAHSKGLFLSQSKLRPLMGINTRAAVDRILYEDQAEGKLLVQLMGDQPIEKEIQLRRQEAQLIGLKIPGFFTTPPNLAARMVRIAGIQSEMRVLEPSAGSGNIADAIKEACPGCHLMLVEINSRLVDILRTKGYNGDSLIHNDFLNLMDNERVTFKKIEGGFDRIIMNPPFEHGQDVDHVRHAFDLLKQGGRLVGIMSEHPFFAEDAKSVAFREWFEDGWGGSEKLPAGIFQNQATSTSVAARLVMIPKM